MLLLKDFKPPKIDNLISLAVFGSYGTEYWIESKSDIDILVLLEYRIDVSNEFKIEDILIHLLEKYFHYNNIHLTFLYLKDFSSSFAKQYIESINKLIIDELKEIDFRLYVNKYIRNNQWLQDRIDEDNEFLRGGKK